MPFLDHLEELRWRLFWCLLAVGIGSVVGFALVYYFEGLQLLMEPVRAASDNPDLRLIYLSPSDPFFITLRLGIMLGIILAFPVVVYQIWAFLSPALEKEEKRAVVPALYLGLVLFIGGVAMGYFAALPVTLEFFQAFQPGALDAQLEASKTLGFIVKMLLAFGIVFELPVVVMILSAMGLVTPQFLRDKRRHAAVVMTVVASLITPGDVITLTILMLLPLLLLYELSIFLSAVIWRRKRKSMEEVLEPSAEAPAESVEAG